MITQVVTTYSEAQAKTMGAEWSKGSLCWPHEWTPIIYTKIKPDWPSSLREERSGEVATLRQSADLILEGGHRTANGRIPRLGWRRIEVNNGYSFRTDAIRFAWKAFALIDACLKIKPGTDAVVVWLDADVQTIQAPPADLWDKLCPPGVDVGWLDRPKTWPETGCFVLRFPGAIPFLQEYIRRYRPEILFTHEQWHDAWIFKMTLETKTGSRTVPMAVEQPGQSGNVWDHCTELSRYFTHAKGVAKKMLTYGEVHL